MVGVEGKDHNTFLAFNIYTTEGWCSGARTGVSHSYNWLLSSDPGYISIVPNSRHQGGPG